MAEYPEIVVAVWKNDLQLVRDLSDEPDSIDPDGRTALLAAAIDSKVEAAKILIAAGADVNFQDPSGWSALHFATQARSAEFTRLLIDAGAEVDLVDSYGNTPLWRATFECLGEGSVIGLLRDHGADAMRKNESGISPAELARSITNYEVAQFFVDVTQ